MIAKPKGTYDLIGLDAELYRYIENVLNSFFEVYNYEFMRTPIFEARELFHRSVGEATDIVTKETYDFTDRGGRNMTLRPEGTAGVVRSVIENKLYGNRNDVLKYFYIGTMYRYERPQSGRNREFTQFGVECLNSDDPLLDAEVISMGFYLFYELGLDDVTVHLNTLGDLPTRENYTKALVEYLTPHIDGLCPDCQKRLNNNPLRILDCKVDADKEILKEVPKISAYLTEQSKERFVKLQEYLDLLGVNYEINERIVRGLDYYDHNVWEYINEEGITLAAGGRYNNLVKNLEGPEMPAVGFAGGIERIINELRKKVTNGLKKECDVYIMSISEEEKYHALMIAQDLRLNGIIVEINSNNLSLKSQFKIADGLNAKQLIILNNEDLQKGLINIKDNATKEEVKVDENEIVEYILGVI